jgi:hypothetical protein
LPASTPAEWLIQVRSNRAARRERDCAGKSEEDASTIGCGVPRVTNGARAGIIDPEEDGSLMGYAHMTMRLQ